MSRANRTFRNELGNLIEIDVQDEDEIEGVMIRLHGPHSTATNLVTPLEAEKLREALNEWHRERSCDERT